MNIEDVVKLGRTPLRVDPRNIQYRALAPTPWTPPASYDFDAEHGNIFPARVYGNDTYGSCVVCAQANAITRMERDEQGITINITDEEVKHEYFVQTGGPDVGLDPISSLNKWRRGWRSGGETHSIHSWAQLRAQDVQQVKEAMIVGQGLQLAARLPISAADQINAHQPWDVVSGPRGQADSWGGHAVYAFAYDPTYVSVWTWGRKQFATYRWMAEYCDFAALVVDNPDRLDGDVAARLLDALAFIP